MNEIDTLVDALVKHLDTMRDNLIEIKRVREKIARIGYTMDTRSIDTVFSNACLAGNISQQLFRSKNKNSGVCDSRSMIWFVLRDKGFTLEKIGEATGKVHGTVLAGLRRHHRLIGVDTFYKKRFDEFLKSFQEIESISASSFSPVPVTEQIQNQNTLTPVQHSSDASGEGLVVISDNKIHRLSCDTHTPVRLSSLPAFHSGPFLPSNWEREQTRLALLSGSTPSKPGH